MRWLGQLTCLIIPIENITAKCSSILGTFAYFLFLLNNFDYNKEEETTIKRRKSDEQNTVETNS